LNQRAEEVLNIPLARLRRGILHLGRSVGPPWGKDQKEAVLAAMIGLQERAR